MQSTTRSPVLALDRAGYAVRRVLTAPAPDEPGRLTRLHNLLDPALDAPEVAPYDDVVLVVDTVAEAARPLAEALRGWATGGVHVVAVG